MKKSYHRGRLETIQDGGINPGDGRGTTQDNAGGLRNSGGKSKGASGEVQVEGTMTDVGKRADAPNR